MAQVAGYFWRPTQADLLRPFLQRYLDALPARIPAVRQNPMTGVDTVPRSTAARRLG